MLTGNATVESAIEGLRHGIWDYLLKPINIPRLRSLLARIPRPYELIDEVQSLRASLRHLGRFGALVGRSDAMQHVYDMIEHNARTETAVLLGRSRYRQEAGRAHAARPEPAPQAVRVVRLPDDRTGRPARCVARQRPVRP